MFDDEGNFIEQDEREEAIEAQQAVLKEVKIKAWEARAARFTGGVYGCEGPYDGHFCTHCHRVFALGDWHATYGCGKDMRIIYLCKEVGRACVVN